MRKAVAHGFGLCSNDTNEMMRALIEGLCEMVIVGISVSIFGLVIAIACAVSRHSVG